MNRDCFELRFELDHIVGSEYNPYGSLDIHVNLDKESMKAYHMWVADGCEGALMITAKGFEYIAPADDVPAVLTGTIPLDENVIDDIREMLKKEADGMPYSTYTDPEARK